MIDIAPAKDCKHPELTYGEICVQCNECGRFDKPPFVTYDFKIIEQGHDGFPPLWRKPRELGGHFESQDGKTKCWYRSDQKIKDGNTIEDIIPDAWYPKGLNHVRWWIEGITC